MVLPLKPSGRSADAIRMETLEKVWRDGAWWAQTPGGDWLRWSEVETAWRPSGPPPDERGPDLGGSSPGPSRGLDFGWSFHRAPRAGVASSGDDLAPPSRVDTWWNRSFPPFSNRRLVFGLAALPFVGLVHALYQRVVHDEGFEWPTYLFTTIAAQVFLAVVWLSGWLRKAADARAGAGGWSVPATGAQPPDAMQAGVPLAAQSSGLPGGVRDFLCGVLVTFAGVELMWLVGGFGSPVSATGLATSAVVAGVSAFVVHFRHTIVALAVVAVLRGAVSALALEILSFMLWSDSDFGNAWLISSALAFLCGLPVWWQLRQTRNAMPQIKTWMILAFCSVLMVLAGTFARFADTGAAPAPRPRPVPASTPYGPTPYAPPPARIGAVSRDTASRMLFDAWRTRSRTTAERVASVGAVETLFHVPVDPAARYLGCGAIDGGWIHCAIAAHGDLLMLGPEHDGAGMFYVDVVERVPADTPITYGEY